MPWKNLLTTMMASVGALSAIAQDIETKAVADRYPTENAVIWNHAEHLTMRFEDGKLTAKSNITDETLLLKDQAATYFNTGTIYHSFFNKLDKWSAATLIPEGDGFREVKSNEYKTTRSEDEDIFYDDAKQTKVTFSSLSKYARTMLNYSIRHTDMHFLNGFYFQSSVPVHKATYKVTVPKSVKLGYMLRGSNTDWVKMTTTDDGDNLTYTWKVLDLPKLRRYDDGPDYAYYMPHILVYIDNYKDPKTDQQTSVFSKVEDLYRYYYPFIKNINTKQDDSLTALVGMLTKDAITPKDKARNIYQWVQQHIRYIAFEDGMGGYVPREAAAICSRRFGDCKDMSSLLVAMCRIAGLDAYFTWIGTRSKPYTYADVPLPVTDNHMICTIKIGDEYIFMDGTDPIIPFGTPPSGIQGKEALVGIDATNFKVIKVPEMESRKNMVTDSTHVALYGKQLKGSVDIAYVGYPAWRMTGLLQYRNENEQQKAIEDISQRGSNKYNQTDFKINPATGADKRMSLHSDFELDDYATGMDKELYVNLNMQRTYENEYADTAIRKVPIIFNYKTNKREVVVMDIPKGYKVSYLPESKEETVPGVWRYKIAYQQNAKQVKLVKEYEVNTLAIDPSKFREHNKMVQHLRNEYKESIVLTKNP